MDISSDELISSVGDALELSAEPEKRQPVTCVIEYGLLPEHLADYADQHGNLASTQKADEKDLSTLRARHHGVARLLAEGVPEGVVAEMCGYDNAYLSTLKKSPAMIELINFYRSPKNETAKVIGERLRMVADMGLAEIMERLSNKPGELSVAELAAVSKLGFDRSGHGPQSTVTNIEEHRLIPSDELRELARQARQSERGRIVEVSTVRNILPAPKDDEE